MNVQKVLVGLSGNASQSTVIEKAVALAKKNKATLIFVHVVEVPFFDFFNVKGSVDAEALKDALSKEVQSFKSEGKVIVSVEFGKPAEVILNEAQKYEADLIIIGGKARDPYLSYLGLTTKGILHTTTIPVLIVKNTEGYGKKTLTLVDLMEKTSDPLNKPIHGYDTEYLYAYMLPDELAMRYRNIQTEEFEHYEDKVRAKVEEVKAEFENSHPNAKLTTIEVNESIPKGVTDYAQEHGFNLIVIKSKNMQGMNSFLLGSVATSVAKISHADVFIDLISEG